MLGYTLQASSRHLQILDYRNLSLTGRCNDPNSWRCMPNCKLTNMEIVPDELGGGENHIWTPQPVRLHTERCQVHTTTWVMPPQGASQSTPSSLGALSHRAWCKHTTVQRQRLWAVTSGMPRAPHTCVFSRLPPWSFTHLEYATMLLLQLGVVDMAALSLDGEHISCQPCGPRTRYMPYSPDPVRPEAIQEGLKQPDLFQMQVCRTVRNTRVKPCSQSLEC